MVQFCKTHNWLLGQTAQPRWGLSVITWSSHNSNLWLFLLSLTLMGGWLLNQLAFLFWCSLYDIFWSSEVDDELRALEESKPEVKIIS